MLRHAVRQLVANDAQGPGETLEDFAVAVPEHHLVSVPEGVVVELPKMHAGIQGEPLAVDRVPAEGLCVKPVGVSQSVVGLIRRGVSRGGFTLLADQLAGKGLGGPGVIHGAVRRTWLQLPDTGRDCRPRKRAAGLDGPDMKQGFLRRPGHGVQAGFVLCRKAPQHVGRDDGAVHICPLYSSAMKTAYEGVTTLRRDTP
ncbi:hypothetical protein D9M72_475690 [compost metagenome]